MKNIKDTVYGNTDEEYQEICDFLNALSTRDPCMLWDSGRMNFWRYNVHAKEAHDALFFRKNVHVWREDNDAVVALFISEYGKNDFFVEVMPEYHEIYPDIFSWIDEHWANTRTDIEIDVVSDDDKKIRRLVSLGFQIKCHYENKRTYNLRNLALSYILEEGFRIQMFSESFNYASRVELVQSAFDNPQYTEGNLRGLISSPDYIDEYNLTVVSPEGKHVAYCVGWHDHAKAQAGYIEPVGTHSGYRRRGFATAVIKECFRRMKAHGIQTVEIASRAEPNVSNFLYDSLQPQTKREVHKYAKVAA